MLKALVAHGMTADMAVGSSVGAINAAYRRCGDLPRSALQHRALTAARVVLIELRHRLEQFAAAMVLVPGAGDRLVRPAQPREHVTPVPTRWPTSDDVFATQLPRERQASGFGALWRTVGQICRPT